MQIKDSVALVTGANRGLGRHFVHALLARGARKVYAAARDPGAIDIPGAVPLKLDVTNADDISALAAAAPDLTLLVNNAAISRNSSLLADDALAAVRAELETNVIGPLAIARTLAPVLARNGGGTVVNILSVLSWVTLPPVATYSMSKSAAWSMTNGLRTELAGQGTNVVALHVGYMDTDMAAGVNGPKVAPAQVAALALDGVEADAREVLADDISHHVKSGLSAVDAPYLGTR